MTVLRRSDREVLDLGRRHIPDPEIATRPYLAISLAEIAPDYVHPETGETLFTIEHEVRSMRHPLFMRPLVNRNPSQSNINYAPGYDAWTPVPRASTTIVVADPSGGSPASRFRLAGNFEPEAFSTGGDALFLIQYLPALAPTVYRVTELDLRTAESVVEALRRYDLDGVMIGRAALARPWLFRQAEAALAGEPVPPEPTLDQQRSLLLEHYRLIIQRFGPVRGTILMRRYACCYSQGHRGARQFRAKVSCTPSRALQC